MNEISPQSIFQINCIQLIIIELIKELNNLNKKSLTLFPGSQTDEISTSKSIVSLSQVTKILIFFLFIKNENEF